MIAVVLRALARNLRNETKTYYSSLQRLASPNEVGRIEPLQVRDICVYPLLEISLLSISGYQKFVLGQTSHRWMTPKIGNASVMQIVSQPFNFLS